MMNKPKYILPPHSNLPFEVPDAYFEKSLVQIIARKEKLEKLPFETPSIYFEALSENIEKRILPKEQPFTVPEEYFSTLGRTILERKNEKVQVPSLAPWHYGLAGAAAVLLLIGLFFFLPKKTDDIQITRFEASSVLLAAINKADVQYYLETNRGLHDDIIIEVAEQKNIKLPEFGEQKISKKEKEEWKEELEMEDLDDLDLEM